MINNGQSCLEVVAPLASRVRDMAKPTFLGGFQRLSGCQGCVQMTGGSGRDRLKHDVCPATQAPAQGQNLNHTLDFRHPEIQGIPITLMRKVGLLVRECGIHPLGVKDRWAVSPDHQHRGGRDHAAVERGGTKVQQGRWRVFSNEDSGHL